MLHIYYGNGKGKTTAAVGLTVRAYGAGLKTAFFQFLKNGSSSEIAILRSLKNITIMCCEVCNKFTFKMNETEKCNVAQYHTKMLIKASDMIENANIQLIVLDEFIDAYNKKLIDTELVEEFIKKYSEKCEIVMTGRIPDEELKKQADYLTEMKAVKHPFEKGLNARKGIEY